MAAMDPETLSHYLDHPIQAPPPGVTPNFVNPDSTAYQVYITASVCIPVMVIFSLASVLRKTYLNKKTVLTHDIVFFVGLVLCLGFIGMAVACVSGGSFGRQAWNVRLGDFTKAQLVLCLLNEIFGPLCLWLVKISLLMLYIRLFDIVRWVRIISIVGVVVITAFHISVSIAFGAMCSPTTGSGQLDFLAAFISESCSRTRVIVLVQGVGGVVTDLFILIIPLPVVWTLRMSVRRKIGISSMFLVGLCGCASSIIGLVYRIQYYTAGQDNIRLVVPTWATAIAELAAGVMICCMPAMAAVCRSFKTPLVSGFSSARERMLRLTGIGGSRGTSFRPGVIISASNSNLGAGRKDMERKESGRSENPIYYPYAGNRQNEPRFTGWTDTEVDTYSLQELEVQGTTGLQRRPMSVSRGRFKATLGSLKRGGLQTERRLL